MLRSHAARNIEQTRGPLAGPHIMFLSALKSRCTGNVTPKQRIIGRERLPYVSNELGILIQLKCIKLKEKRKKWKM